MSRLQVVIVADDLTGALDVAGPFANRGHATWVAVDPRQVDPERFAAAEVLSVNATSRHLTTGLAAALVRESVERLCPQRTEILIKKIDSTLRGNVAAETLAAMEASGRPNAIVVPAFPAQGRTVSQAIVHVKGVPLPQTSFAHDALSPPPRDPLDVVFRAAAPGAVVQAVPPHGPFELSARGERPRIYVVDSASDADLLTTITALRARLADCVLVGSAGIAGAVAQAHLQARAYPPPPRVSGDILVVVGSRAEQSAVQVDALARQAGAALFRAPNGKLEDDAVLHDGRPVVILRAVHGADGTAADAAEVARALARSAVRVLHTGRIEALLATGGDTAIAILDALGVPALQVMGDLLPGIPYSRLDLEGRTLWLLTKAGGFGVPETLCEVVALLRGPAA
jgi:D-threonate/D-erythronate kinase